MPQVTLITATGGRPEAFALCERWMAKQSYGGELQWIVVDDGPEPTPVNLGQTVVRPAPLWSPGQITLARNLLAALPHVRGEKVLFIEDDEYYGPRYLANMDAALDMAPIAGQVPARYYNLPSRKYRDCGNYAHASLCQTGIRASYLQAVRWVCERNTKFIDIELFRHADSVYLDRFRDDVVGMKGLPGRGGIGMGHKPKGGSWSADPDLAVLNDWLGADAAAYEGIKC